MAPPVNVVISGILTYWYNANSFWSAVMGSPVISSLGPVLIILKGSTSISDLPTAKYYV